MFYGLINIPDFRPSQAHPLHRAKRKAIEEANPHFDLKEAGLKAAVLAILAVVACYPRIKAEHDLKHHPERVGDKGKGKEDRGHGGGRGGGYNRERYRKRDRIEPGGGNWDRSVDRRRG
jgi:hypothetical protein